MKNPLISCKTCGQMISKTADKCPQCGQKFGNAGSSALTAAGWLAIVLGGLGTFGGNPGVGIPLILIGAGMAYGGDALKRASR